MLLNNKIEDVVADGTPLLLEDASGEQFYYFHNFKMLIPIQQDDIGKLYSSSITFENELKKYLLKVPVNKVLIKASHSDIVFSKLLQIMNFDMNLRKWKLTSSRWFVDNSTSRVKGLPAYGVVWNGYTKKLEVQKENQKARVLRVIYLSPKAIAPDRKIDLTELEIKYGLRISDAWLAGNGFNSNNNLIGLEKEKQSEPEDDKKIAPNLQKLLDCDKKRCGLASYERELLYDIKAGHWDLFEQTGTEGIRDDNLVARDPKRDVKKNGVIGIDFGTKSTVVVKQEGSNEIRPVRIGSLSLSAEVAESDYENPTIISCINLRSFLEQYSAAEGRPDTSCEDLFVSYNAYNDYKNCPTESFYAYYSDLKQWANSEKKDAVVQDIKEKAKYKLQEECSLEKQSLNPIEVYAYYIGMYINNMRNGIYLKYVMSFPVKYSKATKELIRSSFERGIKKSLPRTIVEDAALMENFSVEYQISEPAAYAVTALEQSGFVPQDETEKYLYGIFDFGGGTTDFDFGVWRGASEDEYDKYNCDYVLECFGADSDVRLGGENILELLAYQVFKENKKMAAEKKVACALPADQTAFIGGEQLISNSQSANRNLTLLKEALRPLWEQHEKWEEKYCKKDSTANQTNGEKQKKEEYIELQLYDFNGKPVPNCKFKIDTTQLIQLIKQRIQKGVDAFFKCIEKSILGNEAAQFASEKIYIFLAGNSCKSIFVKELFETTIHSYNKEYSKIGGAEQDRFELIEPLTSQAMDEQYIPNAKTSVAYGLVKSRPGGKIYVKKNYETNADEETRFKYYLGTDRRGKFECKLAPMMQNEAGESQTSYGTWYKFQGAGMGVARVYYTEDARADSKLEKLEIGNIPFHEITFQAEEGAYLFVKAIEPSVIRYAIATAVEEIDETAAEKLDIDAK